MLTAERATQVSVVTPRFQVQSTDIAQDGQAGAYVIPLRCLDQRTLSRTIVSPLDKLRTSVNMV